jgi:beta-galactosidase/beta-glucuronidase
VPEVCIDRLEKHAGCGCQFAPPVGGGEQSLRNLRVEVVASAAGKEIARVTGLANAELILPLPNPHLWSPDDPFLYDLKVTLVDG